MCRALWESGTRNTGENVLNQFHCCSSHSVLTLAGRGFRALDTHSSRGNHYVHLKVKIPTALTEEQKQIVLEFARLERDTPGTVNGIHPSEQGKTRRSRAETREEGTRAAQEETVDTEEKEGFFQRWKKKLLGRFVDREVFYGPEE